MAFDRLSHGQKNTRTDRKRASLLWTSDSLQPARAGHRVFDYGRARVGNQRVGGVQCRHGRHQDSGAALFHRRRLLFRVADENGNELASFSAGRMGRHARWSCGSLFCLYRL